MNRPDRSSEILAEAGNLFLTYGYRKTTLDDVANAVKISKSTLYHYFTSKEELFRAVAIERLEARFEEIKRALSSHEDIRESLLEYWRSVRADVEMVDFAKRFLFGEVQEFFPVIQDIADTYFERLTGMVVDRLELAVEKNQLRALPARKVAIIFLTLLYDAIHFPEFIPLIREIGDDPGFIVDILLDRYYTVSR